MPISYPIFDEQTLLEDAKKYATGLIPRDFNAQPFGSLGPEFSALPFPTFDRATWKERLEEQERKGLTIPQLCDYYKIGVKNQGQTNYCFPGNTRITLVSGIRKPICEIAVGDEVLTAEGRKGKVTALSKRYVEEELHEIWVQGRHLMATSEHPIRTEHGYFAISELQVGAKVIRVALADRPEMWAVPIDKVDRKKHKGYVYNFSVQGDESYVAEGIGVHNCWINAPVHALEIVRAIQGQQRVRLSPASVGAKIKGFRNVGGWGTEGLRYLVQHGAVPSEFWPDNAIDRKYDTEANNQHRAKYKVTEWWELRPRRFEELATCLLCGYPVAVGYNWWRHEVTAVALTMQGNEFGIVIDNSWGPSWGSNGRGVLMGSKANPDDAVAPRVAVAA